MIPRKIGLNERSEILQRCRHKDSLLLTNNYRRHSRRRQEDNQDPVGTVPDEDLIHVIPGRPPDEPPEDGPEEEPRERERPLRAGSITDYSRFF